MRPTEPQKEHPSTYFVEDRANNDEMTRLDIQDTLLTTGMGGVLPEQTDTHSIRCVLDVGCGTGGWLMATARAYPTIEKLVGADISDKMIAYARDQAKAEQLDGRVQFQTMDALRALNFPDASFDLVNQRLGFSWLRTWDWTKILLEYRRVCRIGGIIRVTEPRVVASYKNSPALEKLNKIALQVNYRSGRLWFESSDGVISQLAILFARHSIADIHTQVHTLTYRAGTSEGQSFARDIALFYRVALPFFQKWTRVPANYEEIYQQAIQELDRSDFMVTSTLVTVWGAKSDGQILFMRGLN